MKLLILSAEEKDRIKQLEIDKVKHWAQSKGYNVNSKTKVTNKIDTNDDKSAVLDIKNITGLENLKTEVYISDDILAKEDDIGNVTVANISYIIKIEGIIEIDDVLHYEIWKAHNVITRILNKEPQYSTKNNITQWLDKNSCKITINCHDGTEDISKFLDQSFDYVRMLLNVYKLGNNEIYGAYLDITSEEIEGIVNTYITNRIEYENKIHNYNISMDEYRREAHEYFYNL